MKIEKVSIDSIKLYHNNDKIHTAEQIEEIKKSIQEFGNNDPIAIDEKRFYNRRRRKIPGTKRYGTKRNRGYKTYTFI